MVWLLDQQEEPLSAQLKIMKKKTLQSAKDNRHVRSAEASPVSSNQESASSDKDQEKQTVRPVMTARSTKQLETGDRFQRQVPLFQITMSVFQIDQTFKLEDRQAVPGNQDSVPIDVSRFIGMGRTHRAQWTMVTAPMIGIAKKQGKIKMDF